MDQNQIALESRPFFSHLMAGLEAEYRGNRIDAAAAYHRAWQMVRDDYESCIVAHYVARVQSTSAEMLQWNFDALQFALNCEDRSIEYLLPSLYLALGQSYEISGDLQTAAQYFSVAQELGLPHAANSPTNKDLIQAHQIPIES